MARTYTLDGRVGALVVRGKTLEANIAEAITKATLDLTSGEVTQLDLRIADPKLELLRAGLFTPSTKTTAGSQVDYGPLKLEVRALGVVPGASGDELAVTARSLGACKLRRAMGPHVRRNLSPTQAVALDAAAAGLRFVGEPSAKRDTVVRQGGDQLESAWDADGRLAQELGYVFGEAAGVLYFGRPTWLVEHNSRLRVEWRDADTDGGIVRLGNLRRSGDDDNNAATIDGLEVVPELGDKLLPFMGLDLAGVPSFDGRYMVTNVKLELDDGAMSTVSAATPVNPTPQPPETSAGSSSSSSASSSDGAATAAAFVDVALKQAGDRYVYGAEAKVNDPDPDAFDCSELVEWALGRVGVRFVDGSSAQIARCKSITVAEAKRTRGALLWHSGHIAISLGDGRTIEAMGRKYGVLVASSGSRFTKGGLIPGLRYS